MRQLPVVAALLIAVPAVAQTAYGPQSTLTCPPGAVDIFPGQSIQLVVNAYPAGATFCLRAGVYQVTSSITPKSGDIFVGEYGAILDGSTWVTSDGSQAAFRALNQDIDDVTIRNLVIRKMPQYGITAFWQYSSGWTVEYNELANNKFGIEVPASATVRFNYIHHNVSSTPTAISPQERGGGYICQKCDGTLFEGNEIAYNGYEQKVAGQSVGVHFRNNFVHHNLGDGIWYDTNYASAAIVENNRVEDNGRAGIDIEATNGAIVRNNTIRRNKDDGVFNYRSQDVQVYGNVVEGNLGGVEYYTSCDQTSTQEDLKNNSTHDNIITVGTAFSNPWATAFSFPAACSATTIAPYLSGARNLTFSNNTYQVPSASSNYWGWGGWKSWAQWQGIPQDVTSTLNGSAPPPLPVLEICGDGVDNDGDGLIDEGCVTPPVPTLDTLAPTVTLSQPKRSGKSSNFSVTTTATDNVAVTWFALSIDGQVFASQPGSYSVQITRTGVHTFKAEAKDAAGWYTSVTASVTR